MTDFEQIYKDYFRDVFLYVRRLSGGDERLAEDITSEAFFRALRRIDSFRGDCDIRVWLCQIAKNCYYTHLKQSRRTEHTADMEQLISEAEESPDEMLLRSENAQQVKHLLHQLSLFRLPDMLVLLKQLVLVLLEPCLRVSHLKQVLLRLLQLQV